MKCNDAKSVLKHWEDNNEQKVLDYVKDHEWLLADVEKLRDFQCEHRLVKLAITSSRIFGLDSLGVVHATGRGNLGIADNFA